ncbi:TlpA disulfide reductase family protein [Pedobacter sp. ASV28]|uniref:TlpA family protein disulfide reductase n=1 Tax=Pedobacter sp. ASV28 TaxID=2795123 RepID=UPI0018EAFB3E|nr:TlpA disulfide reductase family protein [Pedobacter sp. ASV28]
MEINALKKYIYNGIFILCLGLILIVPSAKALLLQGLMQVGLFDPETQTEKTTLTSQSLAIQFKDSKGKITSLAELKGKVVFLNFWATWCPPCLAEMPSINKLYEQYKDHENVAFIMVDADHDFAKSNAYMNRKGYQLPIYQMASNVPEDLFSRSLPTTIVFDKKGRLSFKHEGVANYHSKKFTTFIQQLIDLKN